MSGLVTASATGALVIEFALLNGAGEKILPETLKIGKTDMFGHREVIKTNLSDTVAPNIVIGITDTLLTAVTSDNTTANPVLQLYIDGIAVGIPKTGTTWDLEALGLPVGIYTIAVLASDSFGNATLSNTLSYVVPDYITVETYQFTQFIVV